MKNTGQDILTNMFNIQYDFGSNNVL